MPKFRTGRPFFHQIQYVHVRHLDPEIYEQVDIHIHIPGRLHPQGWAKRRCDDLYCAGSAFTGRE